MIDSTQTLFEGAVDFTNATVTGIGAPGLVSGTGTDSMKSDDSINNCSICSCRCKVYSYWWKRCQLQTLMVLLLLVLLLTYHQHRDVDYISIGQDVFIAQNYAIGKNTNAQSDRGLAMVEGATVASDGGIVIGYFDRNRCF